MIGGQNAIAWHYASIFSSNVSLIDSELKKMDLALDNTVVYKTTIIVLASKTTDKWSHQLNKMH